MSLYDLIQRTDLILKKYEKYDTPMAKAEKKSGGDPFMDEVEEIEGQIEYWLQQAEEIAREKNKAVVAQRNAEIRKQKDNMLRSDLENLQKKIKKGKTNKDIIRQRQETIQQLAEKISNIPDGLGGVRRPFKLAGGIGPSKRGTALELTPLHSDHLANNPLYFQHTDETQKFEQEAQQAFKKQDEQLNRIEMGLGELEQLAKGINEEIDKQNPVISEIDHQMSIAISNLKTNNAKLKGILDRVRSSRNFICDVILIALLLGIGAYIYSMLE